MRKGLSRLRHWKNDLFVQTQTRLTLQYSVLLMFFLALFMAIVYFLMDFAITFEQERQLHSITNQESVLMHQYLRDGKLSQNEFNQLNAFRQRGNQFFYYVMTPNGTLLFADEFITPVRSEILQIVQGWIPHKREIRYETIQIPPLPPREGRPTPTVEREIHLMMTGRTIYLNGQLAGIFYTGKDVSFTYELIHRFLVILVVIGILFLGVALLLSFWMSKRAMVPIRQSFQRQREFVADASHELRTPLSILQSSLEVFELEEGERISDFSRNVMSNMKDEVRRMSKLVSDLLTLARSDTGHPDLLCETFDFMPAVEQVFRSTHMLAHAKKINLHLHAPPSLTVYGDQERLKQLVYILLDNAIKYTPEGGEVNLSIGLESPDKQPCLSIAVQDTGVGIPREEQERIFDRFYRVDKNRSRQTGGTGLGLAIAKWIAEAHHGTISVFSTPGKGSTFTVKIPMTQRSGLWPEAAKGQAARLHPKNE